MNSSQSPSPQLGKSTYSSGARRDVLWNVVQPGDPYDIRKSMIAKLPGDREHFMGDNLQIVCLLQSAQIERLCQFLDDYKFRYREIERRQLDRHSYEIQIKQLTQQLAESGSFRSENSKLKDFIKKQTLEIEELKNNKHYVDNNLRANYESSLAQIQTLLKQIAFFKSEKQSYIIQINNFSARIEAMESARDRELKQVFNKYADESKFAIENQTKSLKSRYESQINRLQFEIKRLKQFNDAKNLEINELSSKNRSLLSEIDDLRSSKGRPDPAYLSQVQQRFALMGQQIERLNLRIKQSTSKIDESSRNELYWKDKYTRMQQDYKSIQIRYRESTEQYRTLTIQFEKLQSTSSSAGQGSSKYQDQIRQLNAQIKRLEDDKANEISRYSTLQKQYSELEYNYSRVSVIEREYSELKNNQSNNQDMKRKIAQYETKIALLSQELQRAEGQSEKVNTQKQGYDELRNDYQEFKRKSLEKQRSITQKYESQMQRRVLEYETRLAKYAQESGNEFQIRLQAINREVERLNQYLKEKTDQSEANKRRIRELENSINQKYEIDANRQYSSFEVTIKELKVQNEDLNRKIREFDNINKKIAEYENKLALLTQEIQRLTYQLKAKTEQSQNLMIRLQRSEQQRPTSNTQDFQLSRKISVYEETQYKLTRENEDLRRKLQEIVQLNRRLKQYEDRIRMMGQQTQRINLALKQKVEMLNRSEANARTIAQQLQHLRRNRLQIESSFSQRFEQEKMQTSRKFTNYEQSLSSVQREYEQLRRRMMDMGNDSNRKVAEYENRIVLLTQQLERLNQTYKLKINQYENVIQGQRGELELSRRENKELQINITQKYEMETSRKIGMYEQNMTGLTRELQDLRRRINEYENALRKKNEEISQLENRYRVVSQEYESFKHQVKSFEGEVTRSQSSYEQNMTRITREYEQLKRKIVEYENRLALTAQENERLNTVIRNSQQEGETLRRTINELKVQITQKYEIETSRKISGYEQNMNLLNREKEDYKRKLAELETRIANLTRELEDRNRKLIDSENKIRQSLQENESLNNRFRELQMTVTQKYQVETSRKITTYEQNIQNMGRELQTLRLKITEYQNLRINYQKQINRLNIVLKNSGEQQQKLRIHMRQIQTQVTHKYETEVTRQFTVYQQNITNLNQQLQEWRRKLMNAEQMSKNQAIELEELRRRLKEFGDVHRAVGEYESQFGLLRQELERVNGNLKGKTEESTMLDNKLRAVLQQNQELKRKIKQVEISIANKYQFEITQKSTTFEQNLGNIKRENDELRRKLAELQNKIVMMNQEIQRLNGILKQKVEEFNASEMRGRNWQQEIQTLRRKIAEIEKSSSQRFETEITRTVSLYEQNMTTISREYEQFKRNSQRGIAELETKVALLSQQLERASQALRMRGDQLAQSEMRFKNSVQEIEKLQRALREMQVSNSKRFDTQKTTIISTYEQNITVITRQFEQYKVQSSRKIAEYQNKLMQLTRELERVNGNLGKKVDDSTNLERRVMQLTQEVQGLRRQIKENEASFNQRYQVELTRKVSAYETNFTTLKGQLQGLDRKNKQLNRRIAEDQNKIALMTQQIQRLNQVLRGKSDQAKHYQSQVQKYVLQLQNLKTNISGYYTTQIQKLNGIIKQRTQQYQLLQQKFSQFQTGQDSELKQLQSSYSMVSKQYESSKKHLAEYEQSIRKLYSEFERLQVIINELKVQRQTLFDKNSGLLKEIERLNSENKDQQSQIYELRLKFTDEVSLQKRINEHMALMVVLFAQIETLRQRVKDKEKEVQEVRRSSLAPLKA